MLALRKDKAVLTVESSPVNGTTEMIYQALFQHSQKGSEFLTPEIWNHRDIRHFCVLLFNSTAIYKAYFLVHF